MLVASFLSKARAFARFEEVVAEYAIVPERLTRVGAATVVCAEGVLGLALVTGTGGLLAVALTAVLFTVFGVAVAINLRRGRRVPCGCFGSTEEEISRRTLARVGLLITAATTLIAMVLSGSSLTAVSELMAGGSQEFGYMLQIASLGGFLILVGMWILALPEVIRLLSPRVTAPQEEKEG